MDELIIDDKKYISSKHAAKITGYAKDYVGQLCREGRIEARLVGRSWYVLETSVREHRYGAEVAEETVPEADQSINAEEEVVSASERIPETSSNVTYIHEESAFLPELQENTLETSAEMPLESSTTNATGVSDMQSVWKEWFDKREFTAPIAQSESEIEEEVMEEDDFQEKAEPYQAQEEEFVPIHRTYSTREVEAPSISHSRGGFQDMDIRSSDVEQEEPLEEEEEEWEAPARASRSRRRILPSFQVGGGIIRAGFVALIFIVLAVTFIGTGFADRYIAAGIESQGPLSVLAGVSYVIGTSN